MKFLYANRIAPDVTPRFAASRLGLYCFPMSHKRDATVTPCLNESNKSIFAALKFRDHCRLEYFRGS